MFMFLYSLLNIICFMYIGTVELVGKGFHQVKGKNHEGVGTEGDE